MIKAAFFDMDGVLFNSMPGHALAWEIVMQAHGLDFTKQDTYLQEGRTGESVITECIRRDLGRDPMPGECAAIYAEKTQCFTQYGEAAIIPGVDDLLTLLQQQGVLLFVVTGSGQKSLLDRLNHYFPGCFAPERVVSAGDYVHGKPNPEPYLRAFEKARNLLPDLLKTDCVVVENAPLGTRAGVAAGLQVWAVNTGPLSDDVLAREGAAHVFKTMKEVIEVVSINCHRDKL